MKLLVVIEALITLKDLTGNSFNRSYRVVGGHSAVKTCHWVGRSLKTGGAEHCYKQRFYGVPCHRCLQMTPSLGHCTQSRLFCWRDTPETVGVDWDQVSPISNGDDPDTIVEGCIEAHRNLISGYGGDPDVPRKSLDEALNPIHAAISLEGEPTLYPGLGELVDAFYTNGFRTVFIVTNGTRPEALKGLSKEPSQLYISVCAPDEETYRATCRPMIPDGWGNLMETLDMLQSFNCPTVLRHTLVPRLNMGNVEGYARLAERSNATYLEPKAAMSVGAARKRFGYDEMAWHSEIKSFAKELSRRSGYMILDEQPISSVVLLGRIEKPIKLY